MKIDTVAILGAGAIGAYLWWGLNEKLGDKLCLVAAGGRKQRLENSGLVINNITYKPVVKTPAEAKSADLLIIATKYGALKSALPDIKEITTENTIVMSLLNGVDSEELIGSVINPSQIIYSLIRIASERVDNSITFDPSAVEGIFFGEVNSEYKASAQRVDAIDMLFKDTPLVYHISDDIITEQWNKFAWNLSYNLPQAILGVGFGAYVDSSHVDFISHKIWDEVTAVAAAKGAKVKGYPNVHNLRDNTARFSTLQDLDAKRPTEIDMFAGVMIQLGTQLNIHVPYCEYTYHIIKALEEKNEGKFDY